MRPRTWTADLLLLLAAAIWGFAFVAQRLGMEHVGPFTFNGVRFLLGALSLLPILLWPGLRVGALAPESRGIRGALLGGVVAGTALFLGASLQQVGIVTTTAGKAGFITGLYMVVVPILGLLWRERPGLGTWLGAGIATVGLYLLSVTETLTMERGDFLVLVGTLFWAIHVHLIGYFSRRIRPALLACIQFLTCSLLSLIVAFLFETPRLDGIEAAALPILYGGLLSVGVAYTLQVVAQRDAPAAHAALILSLETVFAAVGGALVLGERIGLRGLAGCALMLVGILASQGSRLRERKS